ncbi:MAG: lipocalin family protein [Sphingobacteriaceae bacterium]|nr:lipocalin family protein [Sphingobacteriaceae bacterium]
MNYLKLLSLALISVAAISCSRDKKEELAKTWQVSDIETETELVDSIKNAMLLSSTMQFTEDGHYTTSGGIGADQGTYTLDEEGKTLSTISLAGRNSDVYTIEELDKEKLVLSRKGSTITCKAVKQ